MIESGINMQCIKEYKPSANVQYEQIHYKEIKRVERIEKTLQVKESGEWNLLHSTPNFHS